MANSWQQPNTTEPGGATWHKVADPATGWLASKIAGWTADTFGETPYALPNTKGLTVDFSAVVPVGTKAVRVVIANDTAGGPLFARKGGDTNISNTPIASSEWSHIIMNFQSERSLVELWLSSTYTVDFAVASVNQDIFIAYPVEYML